MCSVLCFSVPLKVIQNETLHRNKFVDMFFIHTFAE